MKKIAYRWLRQHAKVARLWILLTIGLSLSSGLLFIVQASLLAHIIDQAYIHQLSSQLLMLPLLGLLAVMLVRAGLAWLRQVVSCHAAISVQLEVRRLLCHHLFALSPVQIASLQAGATASAVVEQVEALHDFFAYYLPQLAVVALLPLVILAFVFPLNWICGLLLLVAAPLIPLFMVLIGMGAESLNQRHFEALARFGGYFLDVLQGLTTLKLFMQSRGSFVAIKAVIDAYRQKTMSVLRVAFLSSAVLELFSSIAIALLAVFLGVSLLGQVAYGSWGQSLTLHRALFILLLAPEFFLPLRQLAVHYHARAEAVASAHQLLQLLQHKPHQHQGSRQLSPTRRIGITLSQVSFAYDNQSFLLENVALSIAPGEHIAITGASGVGKTTLLNLLCGFVQPTQGTIAANGVDLNQLSISHWRQQLALLEQNPRLFYGSIADNIRLAHPDADDCAIEKAARQAGIWAFCQQLPYRLNTVIGEQNDGLSGGQAQRLALARIYLADKPVLLLDEPTASLDHQTEHAVLKTLVNFMMGRTVIIVSHRISTAIQADRIMKIDQGRLIDITAAVKRSEAHV